MSRFHYYGLIMMAIIMIPNILYAVKHKNRTADSYHGKAVIMMEQLGRYGCFVFMIFNIPYTYLNFRFDYALAIYLSVNGVPCLLYLLFWIIYRNKNSKLKALSLSILPSCIFLFSGAMLVNVPLFVFAIVFSVNHILISYKNAQNPHVKKL